MPPGNLRARRVGGVCAGPGFDLCFLASQPCRTAAALWVKYMIPGIEMPLPEAELSHQPVRCCEGRAGQMGAAMRRPLWAQSLPPVCPWVCAAHPAQGAVPGQGLASAQTVVPVCGVGGHVSQGCLPCRRLLLITLHSQPAGPCASVLYCVLGKSTGLALARPWCVPCLVSRRGWAVGISWHREAARDSGWPLAVCGQSSVIASDAEPWASSMRTGCW